MSKLFFIRLYLFCNPNKTKRCGLITENYSLGLENLLVLQINLDEIQWKFYSLLKFGSISYNSNIIGWLYIWSLNWALWLYLFLPCDCSTLWLYGIILNVQTFIKSNNGKLKSSRREKEKDVSFSCLEIQEKSWLYSSNKKSSNQEAVNVNKFNKYNTNTLALIPY